MYWLRQNGNVKSVCYAFLKQIQKSKDLQRKLFVRQPNSRKTYDKKVLHIQKYLLFTLFGLDKTDDYP